MLPAHEFAGMLVLRGRGETIDAERRLVEECRRHAAEEREPAARVWRPHRQVAFGRRDVRAEGYDRARQLARDRGYQPVGRSVGGRAVAFHGTTVAFAWAEPTDDPRRAIPERYGRATGALESALQAVGVDPVREEPTDSFCPGSHSLSAEGGKLVGIAQRVTGDVALVGGVAIPRDRRPIAAVLDPVYDALGVGFDPSSVGSVRDAGGDPDPDALADAIQTELVGEHDARVRQVP